MLNNLLTVAIEGVMLFSFGYVAIAFVAFVHDRATQPKAVAVVPVVEEPKPTPQPAVKPQKNLGDMLRHEVTRRESEATQTPLESMKWVELVAIAKRLKVKRYKSLKKVELIKAIAALS